ncbi:MAG: hypothetical protein WBE75_06085, partial [Candidatus Omnitrophota bacterium]
TGTPLEDFTACMYDGYLWINNAVFDDSALLADVLYHEEAETDYLAGIVDPTDEQIQTAHLQAEEAAEQFGITVLGQGREAFDYLDAAEYNAMDSAAVGSVIVESGRDKTYAILRVLDGEKAVDLLNDYRVAEDVAGKMFMPGDNADYIVETADLLEYLDEEAAAAILAHIPDKAEAYKNAFDVLAWITVGPSGNPESSDQEKAAGLVSMVPGNIAAAILVNDYSAADGEYGNVLSHALILSNFADTQAAAEYINEIYSTEPDLAVYMGTHTSNSGTTVVLAAGGYEDIAAEIWTGLAEELQTKVLEDIGYDAYKIYIQGRDKKDGEVLLARYAGFLDALDTESVETVFSRMENGFSLYGLLSVLNGYSMHEGTKEQVVTWAAGWVERTLTADASERNLEMLSQSLKRMGIDTSVKVFAELSNRDEAVVARAAELIFFRSFDPEIIDPGYMYQIFRQLDEDKQADILSALPKEDEYYASAYECLAKMSAEQNGMANVVKVLADIPAETGINILQQSKKSPDSALSIEKTPALIAASMSDDAQAGQFLAALD